MIQDSPRHVLGAHLAPEPAQFVDNLDRQFHAEVGADDLDGLIIPGAELTVQVSRASGPGGQHVNTTDSRVQLRWNVAESAVLSDAQRGQLQRKLAALPKVDDAGVVMATPANKELLADFDLLTDEGRGAGPDDLLVISGSLPDSVNTPELNIAMQEGEPPKFMDRLMASAHFEDAQVSTIDGLRVEFPDGWGLVRASNTTPILVVRFDADTEEALARIKEDFRQQMLEVRADLELPF